MSRFLVYRNSKARCHLCVCAARDAGHALNIARRLFALDVTAFAVPERRL